jgi:hypothetical protein
MAGWGGGAFWGACSPWGLGDCESEICDFVQTRILAQMDPSVGNRDFRDFMCIVAEPFGKYVDVAKDVAGAFDLNTAVGVQLDMIGSVIDLPRSGITDDEFYRALLKMQATILMGQTDGNWTGSVNQILTMVRTFIDFVSPTAMPIVYTLVPPYAFTLGIPIVMTGAEFSILFRLICKAIYAGVLGYIEIVPTGDNLWDSSHGVAANSAIWCSAHGPTATPCGQWGGLVVTSGC